MHISVIHSVFYSSILVWGIPWTEEAGGLQSLGLQKVGHDWATEQQQQLLWARTLSFHGKHKEGRAEGRKTKQKRVSVHGERPHFSRPHLQRWALLIQTCSPKEGPGHASLGNTPSGHCVPRTSGISVSFCLWLINDIALNRVFMEQLRAFFHLRYFRGSPFWLALYLNCELTLR